MKKGKFIIYKSEHGYYVDNHEEKGYDTMAEALLAIEQIHRVVETTSTVKKLGTFASVAATNADNKKREKEDREKANKGVTRSYRLKK